MSGQKGFAGKWVVLNMAIRGDDTDFAIEKHLVGKMAYCISDAGTYLRVRFYDPDMSYELDKRMFMSLNGLVEAAFGWALFFTALFDIFYLAIKPENFDIISFSILTFSGLLTGAWFGPTGNALRQWNKHRKLRSQ